ncbi:hypothetical protein JI664_22645 [Rhodobacter sp. NTK016B]|uniref:hypothetical protein n=1 Tax=Rhodobacter sp. NTK016B TaxID=2759676 RepID=UPI001A8DC7CA|nr:hypothetical protein [Rhodobacter sp. NTK016B]MBN8294787.1 hypothetical protein [Rhodobacter sp. NTK016B]
MIFVHITSALAMGGMFFVLWGYLPLVWRLRDPVGRVLAVAVAVLALAWTLRSFWWDWARIFLGSNWPAVRDTMGGLDMNGAFNLLVIVSAYLFLRARLLAIPEPERAHWRWWNAWAHPAQRCIIPWRRK